MTTSDLIPEPNSRYLRIFAFDPAISAQYDTASIAEITIAIPWEKNLLPGPIGEYIEVVDIDPASGAFYKPVDLNDPRILSQDGLAPSEVNPQFHQQMVYAVAMTTIGHFEQALGRVALWSSRRMDGDGKSEFVRRLRIYPHALRDRNAFFSPDKKALLFGYFPVGIKDASNTPGTLVFTCLSHDIIAHETTHALLDGVHPHFNMPMNPDVLAFHEAFADVVALFQHFSYTGILRNQVARTRGNLANENLLGKLAQQFGSATGRGRLCAMLWVNPMKLQGSGSRKSLTCMRLIAQASRTLAGPFSSRRSSERSSRCTGRGQLTSTGSPLKAPGYYAKGRSIQTLPTVWPPKRRAAHSRFCRCAFAPSITARLSISRSVITCVQL